MNVGDIGTLLLGVAAVGTMIGAQVRGRRHGKILDEVNQAVNNKQPEEPTLRAVSVETAATVGRMEGLLEAHVKDSERVHQDIYNRLP